MLKDGEPPFSPETNGSFNVPQEITGRGRERFFHLLNLLKETLVVSLLTGAGMFGVLTAIGGAREGVLELSVAVGVTGGAVWIIEPFAYRLPRRLAECIRRR